MGGECSNTSNTSRSSNYVYPNGNWEIAKQNANKIYNYRIVNYNQMKHGPSHIYMIQVEAEYELECIPLAFRRGNSY